MANVVSLFSGIGGFDLGFERAGFTVAATVEIDKQARQVLARHFPNAVHHEDVTHVGQHNLPAADILVGGFPCQDVSVAGRRAGLAGKRSGLWFEFHRVIDDLKPKWTVIENVPGLLSSNDGRDFAAIIHGLAGSGYRVAWRVLDSQYFGVPQRRRRVFIVGSLGDGRAAQVLFERESLPGDTAPRRSTRQGDTAENADCAGTVSSKWAKGTGGPAGDELYNLVTGTLAASGAGTALAAGQKNELDMLVCGGGQNKAVVMYASFVRRLTPVECERLQAFPDNWTAGHSDSARYRMLGNAVTVNVAEWIARRIMEADRG